MMHSRDPRDLDPDLYDRWRKCCFVWAHLHPEGPEPFLTCTFRDNAEQDYLLSLGKTRAKGGESLHNYRPSRALDFAFRKENGECDWSEALFAEFGAIAERYGCEWGGRWKAIHDSPHLQAPGYTWHDAFALKAPTWPDWVA